MHNKYKYDMRLYWKITFRRIYETSKAQYPKPYIEKVLEWASFKLPDPESSRKLILFYTHGVLIEIYIKLDEYNMYNNITRRNK